MRILVAVAFLAAAFLGIDVVFAIPFTEAALTEEAFFTDVALTESAFFTGALFLGATRDEAFLAPVAAFGSAFACFLISWAILEKNISIGRNPSMKTK